MFSIGAVVPLIPYLLGFGSLVAGLAVGGVGLLVAGAVASLFTATTWWWGAIRQLLFGALAAGATYAVGTARRGPGLVGVQPGDLLLGELEVGGGRGVA